MKTRRPQLLLLVALSVMGCVVGDEPDGEVDGEPSDQTEEEQEGELELEGDPNTPEETEHEAGESEVLTIEAATASGLIDAEEARFLTLINNYRVANGRVKLKISVAITRSAHAYSVDMATYNYFSHTGRDGSNWTTRMRRTGYTYSTPTGENLTAGTLRDTAQEAFDSWKGSATHRYNMLYPDFRVIGIGRYYKADSYYGWYWTTHFGGYTDAVLSYGTGTIIGNGGFESATAGTASWKSVRTRGNWYTSNAGRTSSGPYSGSYRLAQNDPDPGGASTTQIVLGAAGIRYTFSAYSRRTSGLKGQSLYLEFLNSSYTRIGVYAVGAAVGTSTAYAKATVQAKAPSGTRFVRVFTYGSSSAGHRSSFAFDSTRLAAD